MNSWSNLFLRAGLIASISTLVACGSSGGTQTAPPSTSSSASSSSSSSVLSSVVSSSVSSSASSSSSSNSSGCAQDVATLIGTNTSRIEAEDYSLCDEQTKTTESGDSLSAGLAISDTGASLSYLVDIQTSGLYTISYQVRASANGSVWSLTTDNRPLTDSTLELAASDAPMWQEISTTALYLSDGPQTLTLNFAQADTALDYLELRYAEPTQYTPHEAVAQMGIGINLGNTLDAYPNEGDWAPVAQEAHLVAFADAGFNHVRIPATWDNHTATSAPYAVNASRMDRTEQVVDWALAQGYHVVLNAHHEIWLKQDYANAAKRARFDAIWKQIAERFKNKSARLSFEILNEPNGMTAAQSNDLNPRILNIIRVSNPNRLVVIAGSGFTPINTLADIELPNDSQLIANFHSYDPWPFAGQCVRGWSTSADKAELEKVYQTARDWAQTNGVPVTVNEFGAAHYDHQNPENICAEADRLAYLREHVNLATEYGIAATVWDDNGSFGVYDREQESWGPEKDILVAPNP
ncbi:cellulase family glycosylhydrolase [Gilvimarinus polysaccharolyticus]|uniref:cellulase family glycosylhydrolase n=1 Tax=Gilvimarinus polysaccharolyticus TaxID=863921 RepID=UPI00067372F7|nr:cellulase family glycosylhydrolase [Gilvimarinus polysaccharolyticus]